MIKSAIYKCIVSYFGYNAVRDKDLAGRVLVGLRKIVKYVTSGQLV